jgi:hypothetical protein
MTRFSFLCACAAFAFGCGGAVATPTPDPAPVDPGPGPTSHASPLVGDFGYQSPAEYDAATVRATATTASFTFQCMKGDTGAIVPDASGAFSVSGQVVTTGGGIVTIPNVTFSGTVSGDTMRLTVAWLTTEETPTGVKPYPETYGPVTLTKGVVPDRWPGCI